MGLEAALTTPSTCTSARLVVKQWLYTRWYIPIEKSNFMREKDKLTTPSSCTSVKGVLSKYYHNIFGYSWDTEYSLPKPTQYVNSGWKSNVVQVD